MSELVSHTEAFEYGLRCPDGSIIWPPDTYQGYPLNTPAERNRMAVVLRGASSELHFDVDAWTELFSWVPRRITHITLSVPVDNAALPMGVSWSDDSVPDVINAEAPAPEPNE